jgi:hypothetical protein
MRRDRVQSLMLVALMVAGASGCFDFAALGNARSDLGAADLSSPAAGDLNTVVRCTAFGDCPTGENCVQQLCRPAVASCAAHKAAFTAATDGIYWIAPGGSPLLAYCDMSVRTELCTTQQGSHTGQTREGSATPFSMTSQLAADGTTCDLWAVRASDGFPLGVWAKPDNSLSLTQCAALGLVDDVAISQCPYGTSAPYSNCGFNVSPLYAYGHECINCALHQGTFTQYTKMGPFTTGAVLSSVDGTTRARCKTR